MAINQTSFKKGQSGNPNGIPLKGHSITEWFRKMLDSNPDVKEALVRSTLNKVLDGDIAAIKLIWNHLDGMPSKQRIYQAIGIYQFLLWVGRA